MSHVHSIKKYISASAEKKNRLGTIFVLVGPAELGISRLCQVSEPGLI